MKTLLFSVVAVVVVVGIGTVGTVALEAVVLVAAVVAVVAAAVMSEVVAVETMAQRTAGAVRVFVVVMAEGVTVVEDAE